MSGKEDGVESRMYECLEKYFGYTEFKSDLQKKAVKAAAKSEYKQKNEWKAKGGDSNACNVIVSIFSMGQESEMFTWVCLQAPGSLFASSCQA